MLPPTMNTSVPNIVFSVTSSRPASAARTRSASAAS
jgi:hypothetical protein